MMANLPPFLVGSAAGLDVALARSLVPSALLRPGISCFEVPLGTSGTYTLLP